jgi:PQQ-dependent catabolism-associated beta-propeller protein
MTSKRHLPDQYQSLWRQILFGAGCILLSIPSLVHSQVYVSNEKDHQLVVFDTQGQFQGRIAVCQRPRSMASTTDRKHILVVCGDSNQLGRIDLASQKLVGTFSLAESPEMLALSPDGQTVYVSSEDDNALIAYELASGRQLFTVKTGGEPEGVAVTPDGRYAYVTSEVANMVHRIDLQQKKILNHIAVGARPRRLSLSPDGKELWVSQELGASVGVIDTASQQLKATVKFQITGMRASDITPVGLLHTPNGRSVWVSLGRANHVAEVDVVTKQMRRAVLVGKRAWGLALNKTGTILYVTNGLSDDMSLVDTVQGKALRTVSAGRVPHSVLVLE